MSVEEENAINEALAYDNRIRNLANMYLELQKLLEKLKSIQDPFEAKLRESLSIIDQALLQYPIKDGKLGISFNGGKDCTALLYLIALCVYGRNPSLFASPNNEPIATVYVERTDSFPDVESFVDVIEKKQLPTFISLERIKGSMKDALFQFIERHPGMSAIFVGVRRDDPFSSTLKAFIETDEGWPKFMRIHPILEWSYDDVWTFIRALDIPYCCLYDQGFTSLGGISDTEPNPILRNPSFKCGYEPAYLLNDPKKERQGRLKNRS